MTASLITKMMIMLRWRGLVNAIINFYCQPNDHISMFSNLCVWHISYHKDDNNAKMIMRWIIIVNVCEMIMTIAASIT